MNRRFFWALPLLLLTFSVINLHAQAKLAIYGTIGAEKSGLPNENWELAGTFGLYYGLTHLAPLDLSIDARGDLSGNINSGLVGPRLALKLPAIPIKPYGEFLIGFQSYSKTAAGLKDPNDFAYRYVLGLDTTILPHIDWRVADFSYALNNSANGDHAKTLSTGLVLRF
jgi:hypothetical protein